MKYLVPFLLFFCLSTRAQESKQFIVDGQVKKTLSAYYLVCTATDNYKVVLSWNEVFNSKNDGILLLNSFDVDPTKKEKGNIAMIVTTDQATGRRFVKGLSKISILRVN